MSVFSNLGISGRPVLLAPLAGVSDHPFRRVCEAQGADLTYVEMLSATALIYGSKNTFSMLARHPEERLVGVQVTGKTVEEVGEAVGILSEQPFETIDLNMGCPVQKVVKNGGGSAILKDPDRVFRSVKASVARTDKPLSVKIRLGWDKNTVTFREVADAAQSAGAGWLTLHGRLRSNDYSDPVRLDLMREMRDLLDIPYIGNGNIFTRDDAEHMQACTGVDGVMVSRGALGNPWVFRDIKSGVTPVTLGEWVGTVDAHLRFQAEEYGDTPRSAVCMRKHLLWYLKGWPGAKRVREQVVQSDSIESARQLIMEYAEFLAKTGAEVRDGIHTKLSDRYAYDPKYEMDRKLDRGVGDDEPEKYIDPVSKVSPKIEQIPEMPNTP